MKKRRSIENIIIDLTPLLDVVFIMLLVVACKLQVTQNDYNKRVDTLDDQTTAADTQQEEYEDLYDSFANIDDYIVFYTVNSHYNPDDIEFRTIDIVSSEKDFVKPSLPLLRRNNDSEGLEKLKNYLEEYASSNPDVTIVVSLNEDDDDILYRDEKRIKNIFDELCSTYPNVRTKH